ncbi:hypothetical protein ACWGQ5_13140 [Streptomyces sp. NPDC055722]
MQLEVIAGQAVERFNALPLDSLSPVDRAWANVWHCIAEAAMDAQHVKDAAVQTA